MKQSIAAQSTADDTPLLMHFPPLWRNRNFFLLATAYVVSVVGDRIHYLVMLALMCYVILHDKTEVVMVISSVCRPGLALANASATICV